MSKPSSTSKSNSPRAMPMETIITRFKSAQQKRLEQERSTQTVTEQKPQEKVKTVKPEKRIKEKKKKNVEGEFYPSKVKRKVVAKKIELKPKHELKLIGQANKRKRCVPRKELPDPNWLTGPPRDSSPRPKKKKYSLQRNLGREEMQRLIEDCGSLDDEDFLEILTCPSPVWWEDPPDGYIEEALFCRPRSTSEVYPSIRTQLLQETTNKKRSSTPNILLKKRKAPRSCGEGTSTKDKLVEKETSVNLELSLNNCDEKFIKKRSKLESLLGQLRNKSLSMPDDKVGKNKGKSVIEGVCDELCANDKEIEVGDKSKGGKAVVRSSSDVESKSNSQSATDDKSSRKGDGNVPDEGRGGDADLKGDGKIPGVTGDVNLSKSSEDVASKRTKTISDSSDDDQLSDLGLQDEDILTNLENMDIPIENEPGKPLTDNECSKTVVSEAKTESSIGPPKKLTKFRNVDIVNEVKASDISNQSTENVAKLKRVYVSNEKVKANFNIVAPKSLAKVRSASAKTDTRSVIFIAKKDTVSFDPKHSHKTSSPIEDYLHMELVEGDTVTVNSNNRNANSLLKPIVAPDKLPKLKRMPKTRTDLVLPVNKTVADTVDSISVVSSQENVDSISDTNICFLNDDDAESEVDKKSDATNNSDNYNSDENLVNTFNVPKCDIELNKSNNNVINIIDMAPKRMQNRTESVLIQSSENKINCIKIKDRFKYRFLLSTLDSDETKTDRQNNVIINELDDTKSNSEIICTETPESRCSIDETETIPNNKIRPIIIDTINNKIPLIKHTHETTSIDTEKCDNGQMNFYYKKCKNVYRRTNKPQSNVSNEILDVRKDNGVVIRETVINPPIVDTNENITASVIDACFDNNNKKSILVSDSKQIKYCLKCSSIFDTAECVYCYIKPGKKRSQYYKCDKCSFKSVRKIRFLRHLSDHCGKC